MARQDERPVPLIDPRRCNGCGLCVAVCPNGALALRGLVVAVVDAQACSYAGHCERICRERAISRPFQIVFGSGSTTS